MLNLKYTYLDFFTEVHFSYLLFSYLVNRDYAIAQTVPFTNHTNTLQTYQNNKIIQNECRTLR